MVTSSSSMSAGGWWDCCPGWYRYDPDRGRYTMNGTGRTWEEAHASGFREVAYQDSTGGLRYHKSDCPEYSDDPEYVSIKEPLRFTLDGAFYPSPMGIPDPAAELLPHCEYCGRRQAKKDEPLCPGCGNVV